MPAYEKSAARTTDWYAVGIISGSAIYLFINLFISARTPFLLGGDQIYFWADAQRMLFGEHPYQDFFQFTPPGTDVFYFALFKLFGPRIWVTNIVVLVVGVALCWVCFSISRQIMSRWSAVLATCLFLTLVYTKMLTATHHWFSVLIILCATSLAMRGITSSRIAAAGLLLGVASFFTHTHAAAAALAFVLFLALQNVRVKQPVRFLLRNLALLGIGFVLAWFACSLYFLVTVGPKLLWYYQITFVRQYMVHTPEGAFLGLGENATWRRLPVLSQFYVVYAILLVTYPICLWESWARFRDRKFPDWEKITLLTFVGSILCIEVGFSLNWLRVFAVSMPAIILLAGWIEKRGRFALRVIWIGIVGLALLQTGARHHRAYVVADLPAGRAAIPKEAYEKFAWMIDHTHPGDFFFQPLGPSLYLPLGVRSPLFVEGLGPPWITRPEFISRTIRQLDARPVRYILWSVHLDPEPGQPDDDYLTPFRLYLHAHYERVLVFSDHDEMWARR